MVRLDRLKLIRFCKAAGFAAFFLVSSALLADEAEVIGPFSTLNNADTSFTLASNKAQDLLNVDITPGGKSVKKRKGYGTAFSLNITTSAVHGVYDFFDSNAVEVSIFFNDSKMSVSANGATPIVYFATGSYGATYQCVDSAGNAYCSNTARTSLIRVNSSTYTLIQSVVSTGTMVAVTPERLVTAGFFEAPNRVDFSKANDFTTWTLAGTSSDPINFTITSPGSKITHITYAHSRVYWFKESSFGYILPGPTQADWVVRTVNSFIGTLYNTSVFRDDILYFQGQDGHFYAWDGSNLTKLSREIQGTIALTQSRVANSWTQTSDSDWNAGVFDSNLFVDTTTTTGQISTTYPDNFSIYRDGTGTTKKVWAFTPDFVVGLGSTQCAVVSGQLNVMGSENGSGTPSLVLSADLATSIVSQGTTYYVKIASVSTSSSLSKLMYFALTDTRRTTVTSMTGTNNYFYAQFASTTSGEAFLRATQANGSVIGAATMSGPFTFPFTFQMFLTPTTYQFTINGSSVIKTGSHTFPSSTVFPQFGYTGQAGLSGIQQGFIIDDFSVVPQTFTFSSAVKNAASLSSWDTLTTNTTTSGGSHVFSMRSSNSSFAASAGSPSWSVVTANAIPTISTGSYFQVRDLFATISTATNITLLDFTQNWVEGSATDKTYAIYHDSSLWWSITNGAGSTTNNRIAKYDLLNQGWLLYDIPTNGMYIRNQGLYFGSPTAGTIFKYGDATDDNGSAINSYWKSKDFFGSSPFLDKDYKRLSLTFLSVNNSTMSVTYTVNGSTATTYSVPLLRGSVSFGKSNRNLPLGTVGATFNLQFGNNAANQQWEVFGGQLDYISKSWNTQ